MDYSRFVLKIAGLILVLFCSSCVLNDRISNRNLTIAFYNVENLFDLKNNPDKYDDEFTPEGDKKWDEVRFSKKINDLARVLSSISKDDLPEIIGLCEVENRDVITDLINSKDLVKGDYKIVHHESPDFRGIDCALIYRKKEFKVLKHFPIEVKFEDDLNYKTRDILYVKGKTKNREEFHVFVNHWPSRIGGLAKTEPKRVYVASLLKSKIDSILNVDSKANIVIMGDMNDEPDNTSLDEVLNAKTPEDNKAEMLNLMYPDDKMNLGSYNYRGNWNMLDNIIISKSLTDDKGFKCLDKKGFVFHEEWMEYKNREGKTSPNRTYGGPNYYGGISDHFPVYMKLSR